MHKIEFTHNAVDVEACLTCRPLLTLCQRELRAHSFAVIRDDLLHMI